MKARRASRLARLGGEHRAAAERDHRRLGAVEHGRGDALPRSRLKPASPSRAKISSIVVPGPRSISLVEVDEGPAEPARDLAAERRLARAHEAGEREVAA